MAASRYIGFDEARVCHANFMKDERGHFELGLQESGSNREMTRDTIKSRKKDASTLLTACSF